ncbi:MAG: mannose-6-phosphate isomerase, partial [Alistipes sp.]|nr:mannose-6-phosphate isomerase [Alistipes sp.]
RIYDYGRPGTDGKPRDLHTELAREAIDYTYLPDYQTHYTPKMDEAVQLARNEHFTVTLFDLSRQQILDLEWLDSFVAVVCTEGAGTLIDDKGRKMSIHQGETVLVPAEAKCLHLIPQDGQLKLLAAWIDG